jgi:PIN domain
MPTKTYIVLDTNILIRFITQGKAGCEEAAWKDLQELGKRSDVTFLVPEVIALEMQKHTVDGMTKKFEQSFELISKGIGKPFSNSNPSEQKVWNEANDIELALQKTLQDLKTEKLQGLTTRFRRVDQWLQSKEITNVPLDHDVTLRTKKRMIGGQYPTFLEKRGDGRSSESDCFIVDSLIQYFDGKATETSQLLICTENVRDFGLVVNEKDPVFVHPTIAKGLPAQSIILQTIAEVVTFAKKHEPIEPPDKKEVEHALSENQKRMADNAVSRDLLELYDLVNGYTRRSLSESELRRMLELYHDLPKRSMPKDKREFLNNVMNDLVRESLPDMEAAWADLGKLRLDPLRAAERRMLDAMQMLNRTNTGHSSPTITSSNRPHATITHISQSTSTEPNPAKVSIDIVNADRKFVEEVASSIKSLGGEVSLDIPKADESKKKDTKGKETKP